MGNILSGVESKGKRKPLASELISDTKKRARVVRPDEEEQIPSIFLCRHPTGAVPADSQRPSGSAQNVGRERCTFCWIRPSPTIRMRRCAKCIGKRNCMPERKERWTRYSSGKAGQVMKSNRSRLKLHKTKHKIFLSHAGAEKSFVEQLCVDLEAKGYCFPFFDQRSHSLPKGKDFAPLILEAAKQCHVAVIVLSEEFLTSKWPMIELGEFFEAKKGGNPELNVLPLFFKLSLEDLDDRSIEERWMPKWRKFASVDKRIDVNQWREAVKALPKVNGFVFEQQKALHKENSGILYRSEVDYRSAITQAICELSPPDLLYGTSETVVGYDRVCETLSSQFVEDPTTGVLLLGLHGMPGLGKTTISKALCDHFHSEFVGRVCRVELGDSSTTPLTRQKEVLKQLWGMKSDVLDIISDVDQGRTLMRNCLNHDRMKRQSAVFLVIDNVASDQHSLDEARAYLEAGFCPKSRIMVTSTSEKIVIDLLSDSKFCKPISALTEEEAGTIFLRTAAPGKVLSTLTVEERRNLGLCVEQCRFRRDGVFYNDKQYHPLALRALANYFRNQHMNRKSLSVWEKCLENVKRGSSPDLFDILELQFKSLDETEQLVFLDIALFGNEWVASAIDDCTPGLENWLTWLAGLHMDTSPESVEDILRQLERSGMIILSEMRIHQLYQEFAVWFVTKGNLSKNEWCVRESAPPYERTRLRIVGLIGGIPRSRVQREWGALVLLQVHSLTHVRELNLEGLDRLRHLELIELKNLETLTLSRENDSLRFVRFSGLDSLKALPDFRSSCIFLQAVVITRCLNLTRPLRMEGCSELKTLCTDLRLCPQIDIDFATSLRSLQRLCLNNLGGGEGDDVLNLEGLGLCSQLKHLTLANLPAKRVLGLAQVTSLRSVEFHNCSCLEHAPEINARTHVFMAHGKGGSGQFVWPTLLRDGITDPGTDTVRRLKELVDEAARDGYSGALLTPKLDESLGPSLNYGLVAHYMALCYSDEEKAERLVPGLRSFIQGAENAEDLFISTINGLLLHLVKGRDEVILPRAGNSSVQNSPF